MRGAGIPTKLCTPSSVRTIDVHGGLEQGAVPSSHQVSVPIAVNDSGAKPGGTGPDGAAGIALVAEVVADVAAAVEVGVALDCAGGDGGLDVVVSSTDGRVYAFNRFGQLLPGFPRTLNAGVAPAQIPAPDRVLDGDIALAGLPVDLFGAVIGRDVGQLRE